MIVGQTGAGKSTVGQILQKHNHIVLEAGDITRERFANESTPSESLFSFFERLLETEGYDLHVNRIARTLYEQALYKCTTSPVVAVGLRTPLQVKRLSGFFSETFTVAIYASEKIRFARVKKRGRSDDPNMFDVFIREDFRELTWGLDRVLFEADQYIFNQRTLDLLEQEILSLPFLSTES